MKLIRIIAILQALCLLPVWVRFVLLPPDFAAVGLWFFVVGVSLATVPYALWQFMRHGDRRAWALVMLVLAVLSVGTPMVMARWDLQPIPLPIAALCAVALALSISIWVLSRPRVWHPEQGIAVGRFNVWLLVLMASWLALILALLVGGLALGFPPPLANDSRGLPLDLVLLHAVSVGLSGLVLGVFGLLFAGVGLWRHPERRGLHAAQLGVSLMLLAALASEAAIVSILLVNPG